MPPLALVSKAPLVSSLLCSLSCSSSAEPLFSLFLFLPDAEHLVTDFEVPGDGGVTDSVPDEHEENHLTFTDSFWTVT